MQNLVAVIIFTTEENNQNLENITNEVRLISSEILVVSLTELDLNVAIEKCNKFAVDTDKNILIITNANFKSDYYKELESVLNLSERHCAVSPRGNNAGLLSVPILENDITKRANVDKSRSCYDAIKESLPRYYVLPYPSSECILIKNSLIKKFGFFDSHCKSIEDAIVTWAITLSQYGYSAISANRVFLENSDIAPCSTSYLQRYPYIIKSKASFLDRGISPYDRFAPAISTNYYEKPRVLLSMYQLSPTYNGTSEHAFSVAKRLIKNYSDKYDFYLLISQENAAFFNVKETFQNIVFPNNLTGIYNVGITFTQVYFNELFVMMNSHCLKIITTVLDLISYRCTYFSVLIDSSIFKKSVQYSDGIITISNFTKNDLIVAFPDLVLEPKIEAIPIATNGLDSTPDSYNTKPLPFDKYILIFGNHLKHKALERIISILPGIDYNFIIVGYHVKTKHKNIFSYQSGRIKHSLISSLYDNCSALLFPSEYEGFGLPIIHTLKRGKKVIVSRTEINNELCSLYAESGDKFIFFDTFDEIKKLIETSDFSTHITASQNSYNYDIVTAKTEEFISKILNEPVCQSLLTRRSELVDTLMPVQKSALATLKSVIKAHFPEFTRIMQNMRHSLHRP